ncbi:uncharacterized protein LOC128545997 [Mercenaria mercenaria]|uniref:uncharacterized protein LOC128545997 n=1 Tax=Mercenaria mercenaria TaxID=6596 RepID=UPI00234F72B1|nr:uncharacterized protein LOC128545997 [Mercenaria mercenaria]
MKKGLSGYLYVQCQNIECGYINCVPHGKTHHMKQKGMPCFAVNTKLGTAMIDSIGDPVRVNNFLSTLNIQPIVNSNLKKMERRAGDVVEKVAQQSAAAAAKDAFTKEMEDVAQVETDEAAKSMEGVIDDLGVATFPDSSPSLR